VTGGARSYVEKIVDAISDKRLNSPVDQISRYAQGVLVSSRGQIERFDKVVMACHADQSLALLGHHASPAEVAALGAIRYQRNLAVLHTDTSVLPRQHRAWAAWNYERAPALHGLHAPDGQPRNDARVCLHYLLNLLQPLPFQQSVVVSLNPLNAIDPTQVHGRFEYAHPGFDSAAIRAQSQIPALQGQQNTYFCGAWTGYGFHEDGLKSGLNVADRLLQLA
jgi:predicted NAD/FAD-binding protein